MAIDAAARGATDAARTETPDRALRITLAAGRIARIDIVDDLDCMADRVCVKMQRCCGSCTNQPVSVSTFGSIKGLLV